MVQFVYRSARGLQAPLLSTLANAVCAVPLRAHIRSGAATTRDSAHSNRPEIRAQHVRGLATFVCVVLLSAALVACPGGGSEGGTQPPTITAASPPAGTAGQVYPGYTFTASGGVPPYSWTASGTMPPGLLLGSNGTVSGTPSQAGVFAFSVTATDSAQPPMSSSSRAAQIKISGFTYTGNMNIPRSGHEATLLLSGEVLLTGGGNGMADSTAELYDPASGAFSPAAGNMTEARIWHTATLLKLTNPQATNYGKVLIVGSVDLSAELYDPGSRTFAATGSMHHARRSPTATLLNTGKVLIAGGNSSTGDLTAELYDPASATFADTGSMTMGRAGQTATLLNDGRVLIAGGGIATAELYDPTSGTFTATAGEMTESRSGHTATLLGAADGAHNGYVLIIGTDGSAELYDPGEQKFTPIGTLPDGPAARAHTASLRSDGTVLAAGGGSGSWRIYNSTSRATLFAAESDGFTNTASLNTARDTHTATVLPNGDVLVAGGSQHSVSTCGIAFCEVTRVLDEAELFK